MNTNSIKKSIMLFTAIVTITVFYNLAAASVVGSWDVEGMMKTKVKIKNKSVTTESYESMLVAFNPDGTFTLSEDNVNISGTWKQKKKNFNVYFSLSDLQPYFDSLENEVYTEQGLTVNISATTATLKGKENKNGTIKGTLTVKASVYYVDYNTKGSMSISYAFTGMEQEPSNGENTGIIVDTSVEGLYLGQATYSVDAFQDICDLGPPPIYEIMAEHQITATFTARLINPIITSPIGNLHITKYTIEYAPLADSLGAPPIATQVKYMNEGILIPAPVGTSGSTVTATIAFIDLSRKTQYEEDMLSGQYNSAIAFINNYVAKYTFEGIDDYGKTFSCQATLNFQIGNFDYCF